MFSALNQGSLIYILDKTSKSKYSVGEIAGITQPKFVTNNNGTNQMVVDIKVKVDGVVNTYNNIDSSASFVTYNNGNLILSETKEGLYNELENAYQTLKYHVDNYENYQKQMIEYETAMKEVNPKYAKDKERDEEINSLKTQVDGINDKLDKVLNYISNQSKN